jgi:hypothetical protein
MANDEREWRELCERAATEPDHEKLVPLADKINQILEDREKKLREQHNGNGQRP